MHISYSFFVVVKTFYSPTSNSSLGLIILVVFEFDFDHIEKLMLKQPVFFYFFKVFPYGVNYISVGVVILLLNYS